jgi:hypothetical protein
MPCMLHSPRKRLSTLSRVISLLALQTVDGLLGILVSIEELQELLALSLVLCFLTLYRFKS